MQACISMREIKGSGWIGLQNDSIQNPRRTVVKNKRYIKMGMFRKSTTHSSLYFVSIFIPISSFFLAHGKTDLLSRYWFMYVNTLSYLISPVSAEEREGAWLFDASELQASPVCNHIPFCFVFFPWLMRRGWNRHSASAAPSSLTLSK